MNDIETSDFQNEILLIERVKCLIIKDDKPSSIMIDGEVYECFWKEDELNIYHSSFNCRFIFKDHRIVDYQIVN